MPPLLFDTLTPRPEVRAGALSDAIFAASLDDVVADAGPDVYRDPAAFLAQCSGPCRQPQSSVY